VIPPISGVAGFSPALPVAPVSTPVAAPVSTQSASGVDFGNALSHGIDALQSTQSTADGLATSASTGGLADVTSYMIASNEAALTTQLTTAVRDKAVAAFTSIMNMQM
jgi:flagellar hook-basal body complex protein FliE